MGKGPSPVNRGRWCPTVRGVVTAKPCYAAGDRTSTALTHRMPPAVKSPRLKKLRLCGLEFNLQNQARLLTRGFTANAC